MLYICKYKGKIYKSDNRYTTSFLLDFANTKLFDDTKVIKVNRLNRTFATNYIFIEDKSNLSLYKEEAILKDNLKIGISKERILSINYEEVFNLKDMQEANKRGIERLKSLIKTNSFKYQEESINTRYNEVDYETYKNINEISAFLDRVMELSNPYLIEELRKDFAKELFFEKSTLNSQLETARIILLNLINVAFEFPTAFEKLYRSNKDMMIDLFINTILDLNEEGKKINNVVELPKVVIDYLEKKKLSDLIAPMQNLNLPDGNDYVVLIDFLDSFTRLEKNVKLRKRRYKIFINNLIRLFELDDSYKLKPLLNFLIKEAWYRPCSNIFSFPLEELEVLKDYVSMAIDNGLEYNKYPNLLVEHNVMLKNLDPLKNIDNEEFVKTIKGYEPMTDSFTSSEFTVLIPKDIYDLVREGNKLHHCVASYANSILEGRSKIFFLRKKTEVEEPFITIEVDKNNNLSHIKGRYNQDPNHTIINLVNKWLNDYKIKKH